MDQKLPEFLKPAEVSVQPAQVHERTPKEQEDRHAHQHNEKMKQEKIAQILVELDAELTDPLRVIAQRILRLTFEEAMKMAEGMHNLEMAGHLTRWARCYLEGVEMPLPCSTAADAHAASSLPRAEGETGLRAVPHTPERSAG